jgi:hypothetical protein
MGKFSSKVRDENNFPYFSFLEMHENKVETSSCWEKERKKPLRNEGEKKRKKYLGSKCKMKR